MHRAPVRQPRRAAAVTRASAQQLSNGSPVLQGLPFFCYILSVMSPLFGKKKSNEKTILVIDIENGSVGAALARLSSSEAPKLFSEKRVHLPALRTRDSGTLALQVDKALKDVLLEMAGVAARVRTHPTAYELGDVSRVIFFLHAPWVALDVAEPGKVVLDAPEDFLSTLRGRTEEVFDAVPVSFQAYGSRVPAVVGGLFNDHADILLLTMTGEVTELSKSQGGVIVGHATVPVGTHTFLRTLGSHAGMTEPEARSALSLMRHKDALSHTSWGEAFQTAGGHFMQESSDVLGQLLRDHTSPQGIYIVAPAPLGEWFARTISDTDSLAGLFPEGSRARAVHPHHTKPFLGVHSQIPDTSLALEVISIDARMSGI